MSENMEHAMNKRLQKACKDLQVITVEAQHLVWALAPRDWIGKRKAAIAKVARDLGWEFSRTWNIAHGRARIIRAEEMDRLRAAGLKLDDLKEQADANRARINDLIHFRHAVAGAGAAHRTGGASAGGREPASRNGGSEETRN